jgi:hypothetical protein
MPATSWQPAASTTSIPAIEADFVIERPRFTTPS